MRRLLRDTGRLYVLGGLLVIGLLGGARLWYLHDIGLSRASWLSRLTMPDTATVGPLYLRAPKGYVLDLDHRRPRVVQKWPVLTVDQAGSELFFGVREREGQLEKWAAKEETCQTTPTTCRLRFDTAGPNVIRCRESTDAEAGLADGGYVGACRIAGAEVMALYVCFGSMCEDLHGIAVEGLGSYKPRPDSSARR